MYRHACQSHQSGDWIVYTCQKCDFEFWDNIVTDEVKFKNVKLTVNHYGGWISDSFKWALENQN